MGKITRFHLMNDGELIEEYCEYKGSEDYLNDGKKIIDAILARCDYDFDRVKKWIFFHKISHLEEEARIEQGNSVQVA